MASDKTKNYIVITNGKFSLVLIISALHAVISADFITWGALLSLNPDLIRFIYIFKNSISSSQANFMKVFEKIKDENTELDDQDKDDDEEDKNDLTSQSTSSMDTVPAQKTHYGITADVKLSVFNYSMLLSKLTKDQEQTSSSAPLGLKLKYKANNMTPATSISPPPYEEEFKVDFPSLFACTHYTFHPISVDSPTFESVVNGAVSVGDCNISAPPFVASIACDFIDKILNHEDFFPSSSSSSSSSPNTKPSHMSQQPSKSDLKKTEEGDEKMDEEKSRISGTFSLAVGTFDVKLLCVPICEVVCYLKTEPISCFVSFAEKESRIASLTAALPSASLKLHHMQFPDHNTSLYLNKIMLGYSSSRTPFHAFLASADSFVINFE